MNIDDFSQLPMLPPIFGVASQVAYIVPDIDAAIKHWSKEHGTGPFLVARNQLPLSNAFYRGEKAEPARVNIAFAYVGELQLELIELIGDTPGLYKEAIDRNHRGVHHYAVCVEDFPAAYNWALDNGFDAVIDAGVDGLARMSYVEHVEQQLILEIIQWNPLTKPYFEGLERKVKEADRQQLIHEFTLADLTPKGAVLLQLAKFSINRMLGRIETTRRTLTENQSENAL